MTGSYGRHDNKDLDQILNLQNSKADVGINVSIADGGSKPSSEKNDGTMYPWPKKVESVLSKDGRNISTLNREGLDSNGFEQSSSMQNLNSEELDLKEKHDGSVKTSLARKAGQF